MHTIKSVQGSQQGCVHGGRIFNIGNFSVVGATMADHADVYSPLFSDNILCVGRLSKIFQAAQDLKESLAEIGLILLPEKSGIYIPSYNQQAEPPQLLARLKHEHPDLANIPWLKEGITLLGCPVGTDAYIHSTLNQV
jgi:hypothetical protein